MSGLIRNVLTILLALCRYRFGGHSTGVSDRLDCHFWVTPWDAGIRILKSDAYLQLAEAAQFDFVIRTGLLRPMLSNGTAFVNVSQLISFMKPVRLFQRVRVSSGILFSDDKCAYFSHEIYVGDVVHAEVLVKMKFKRGRVTVEPYALLQTRFGERPAQLLAWDQTLQAMAAVHQVPS
ncbi:hypothetical protein H8L32_22915 [Undibacterium sp. CY18W]|uniref:Acyl-CoA thioesterase FadM n=1 Tax=Undibacterium hunanense TaxID=2762292 RepID=A0ABR6ZX27_9BURK|nr:hypothetical protein [Undibacterium hunanense]MBC3920334.1 hypothetical protein [Undibacterium hunanense]